MLQSSTDGAAIGLPNWSTPEAVNCTVLPGITLKGMEAGETARPVSVGRTVMLSVLLLVAIPEALVIVTSNW